MKAIRYGIETMDDFVKLHKKAISHKRTSVNTSESMLPCGGLLKSVSDQVGVFKYELDCPMMRGSTLMTVSEREMERQLIELKNNLHTMSKEEVMKRFDDIVQSYQ